MASGCIMGKCFWCMELVWEDEKRVCLKDICSRWVMHEDCFYDFIDKIKKFVEALECTIESEGEEK